ncbi:MAG: hypothetical protein KIT87_08535 [Anaerolineae bacterium]|nr:hypothetical protein [Anaerolineae bacterium]
MQARGLLLLSLLALALIGLVVFLDRPVALADVAVTAGPSTLQPANPALRQLGAATSSFANTTPIAIPQAGAASPYPSTITVTGVSGVITRLVVKLFGVSHTYPRDIDIKLVAPDGRRILLMSDAGPAQGGTSVINATLTFDDAGAPLPCAANLGSGVYHPTNCEDNQGGDEFPPPAPSGVSGDSLGHFVGLNPNGVWSLFIQDDSSGDQGAVQSGWQLDLTVGCPPSVFRGEVQLQARTDYSGTQVGPGRLRPDGKFEFTSAPVTTGPDGKFDLTVNGPGAYIIGAVHSKYLPAHVAVNNPCGVVTLPTVRLLGGDTDGDGLIGIADLVRLGINYGTNPASDPLADIDGNGRVDIADLTMVGSNYGLSETPWSLSAQTEAGSESSHGQR